MAALSDISSIPAGEQLVLVLQCGIAAALGAAVGLERELAGKRAGTRTHMLVAVAAALAVGLGRIVVEETSSGDPTRVLHGVVTGVGFIGAGAILDTKVGRPSGLTTAASILAVAVLGAACALGAPVLAAAVTALTLLTLRAVRAVERITDVIVERRRARGVIDERDD